MAWRFDECLNLRGKKESSDNNLKKLLAQIISQEAFAVKLCPFITEYSGSVEGQNILWATLATNWARAQSPPVPSSLLFHTILFL